MSLKMTYNDWNEQMDYLEWLYLNSNKETQND